MVAVSMVHQLSGGVPRLVNNICERSMMGAYGENVHRIDKRLVRKAAGEVLQPTERFQPMQWVAGGAIAAGAAALLLSIWGFLPRTSPESYANTNTEVVTSKSESEAADESLASQTIIENKSITAAPAALSTATAEPVYSKPNLVKQKSASFLSLINNESLRTE